MATNMKTLNGYGFDASALGGYDPSHYATTEDIQQIRTEIPTELPNPNALTINGQSYDGSAAVNITITGGDGGAAIDDTTPSSTTTYSSQKIESELTALNQANAAQNTEIAKKANDANLAAVAKSGSYNDLTNKPTIPSAYTLPIASATQLGGVMPVAKTDEMTQAVGVDDAGGLWTMSGGGSGGNTGGTSEWTLINDITTEEEVTELIISTDSTGAALNEELLFFRLRCPPGTGDKAKNIELRLNYRASHYNGMNCGMFKYLVNAAGNAQAKEAVAFIDGKKGAVFKTSNGNIRGYNTTMNADFEVEMDTPSMNLAFSAGGTSLKPITNIRLGGTIPAGSRVIMYSKR